MKVLTSGLKPWHRLDYPAIVGRLIRFIPPEHLAGVAWITVSGDKPVDDDPEVLGQYYERYEGDPAVIVIYLETMRRETPAPLQIFPITWKILIAQTLFHEIGHHYQRYSHGIAKNRQEDHAEAYGERCARRAFPGWYRLIDAWEAVGARWNRAMIALLGVRARIFPHARVHYRIGRRCWEEGDWGAVVSHWERALEIDPLFAPARRALPQARARLDRITRRAWAAAVRRPALHQARRRKSGRRKAGRRR